MKKDQPHGNRADNSPERRSGSGNKQKPASGKQPSEKKDPGTNKKGMGNDSAQQEADLEQQHKETLTERD